MPEGVRANAEAVGCVRGSASVYPMGMKAKGRSIVL